MNKILYIILITFIVSNCTFKPVVKHHGVPFLEKKQSQLVVNKSNKNDIKKILGNPSTTSKFDNDLWIYIERKQTQSKISNLGQMQIYKNDIRDLDINFIFTSAIVGSAISEAVGYALALKLNLIHPSMLNL